MYIRAKNGDNPGPGAASTKFDPSHRKQLHIEFNKVVHNVDHQSFIFSAETTTSPRTTVESATTVAPPDLYGLGLPGSVSCPPGYEVLTDQQECETQVTEWTSMPFDIAGIAHYIN